MGRKIFPLLVLIPAMVSTGLSDTVHLQVLADVNREFSGLLDAYLEAVPECPVRPDTPLRLWALDLAWLRAAAAMDSLQGMDPAGFLPDSQVFVWNEFTASTEHIFTVYTDIQRIYHQPALPDSSTSMELEDRLITADSIWRHSQMALLELLSEEEHR